MLYNTIWGYIYIYIIIIIIIIPYYYYIAYHIYYMFVAYVIQSLCCLEFVSSALGSGPGEVSQVHRGDDLQPSSVVYIRLRVLFWV